SALLGLARRLIPELDRDPVAVPAFRDVRRRVVLVVVDVAGGEVGDLAGKVAAADGDQRPAPSPRARSTVSPMSHNIGGQSPTNRARRSALARSSWLTVLARIHRPMHRPMEPRDAACRGRPVSPTRRTRSGVLITFA